MIRPRGGDFCYTSNEINQMVFEINQLKGLVSGFVFGVLLDDGKLNFKACEKLINECFGYENTFHRAIDFCKDVESLLEDIIKLGFKRVITSGQNKTAIEGINNIKKFLKLSKNRIEIVPASGVNLENIKYLNGKLNIKSFHCSGKQLKVSQLQSKIIENYNYDYYVTSKELVLKIIEEIKSLN